MSPEFAVVIPFYQTEAGILGPALESIAAQRGTGSVHVLVVDDASSVPAAPEVRAVKIPPSMTVEVVRRSNGGPAAARNTGLERVPNGTRYVAFLDSDDRWSQDHLARASLALSQGYDFYFADLMQLDQTTSAFHRAGRIVASEHAALPRGEGLLAYQGDIFNQIMRGNPIGTSTVVFDRERFPAIRFREEYYSAGEDYLCWMDFARAGARFALSTQCEATYGRGVNIYSGAQWGTAKHLTRVHNEFKYRHATMTLHPVTAEQAEYLRGKKVELREEFALELLYMLRRAQLPPMKILARQFALDPATMLSPLLLAAKRIAGRTGRWGERDRVSK